MVVICNELMRKNWFPRNKQKERRRKSKKNIYINMRKNKRKRESGRKRNPMRGEDH